MEKEYRTKFCDVLVSSHKMMRLQSFESGVGDVIRRNVQNISFLVCFAYVMRCAIWYHLYNFKNVKNTRGGVLQK